LKFGQDFDVVAVEVGRRRLIEEYIASAISSAAVKGGGRERSVEHSLELRMNRTCDSDLVVGRETRLTFRRDSTRGGEHSRARLRSEEIERVGE
jgi:hypothetical protein